MQIGLLKNLKFVKLRKMKNLIVLLIISTSLFAKIRNPNKLYKKVFSSFQRSEEFIVEDSISEEPVNTKVLKALDQDGNTLGFIREIATTTGCNSQCLPIIVTLFYDKNKSFLTLRSRPGLTKRDHVPFTEANYKELEFILVQNPKLFESVVHPKMMVDAITSETLKAYKPFVVEAAAYTSLRLNLYNQDTLKQLRKIK